MLNVFSALEQEDDEIIIQRKKRGITLDLNMEDRSVSEGFMKQTDVLKKQQIKFFCEEDPKDPAIQIKNRISLQVCNILSLY